jgi:hypothetical protein
MDVRLVPSYDIPMPDVHVHFRVESSPDSRDLGQDLGTPVANGIHVFCNLAEMPLIRSTAAP